MAKEYNPHLHHRQSIRLHGYDYTTSGACFITLVTHQHACLFGKLRESQIQLTQVGTMVATELLRLEKRFANLIIDCWGIMPNHLHIVLCLGLETDIPRVANRNVPSSRASELEEFGKPVPGSIPTIVRSYKSSVTQRYHRLERGTLWQRGYYEHIVRSETELNQVRSYIEDNPRRWLEDNEYRDA